MAYLAPFALLGPDSLLTSGFILHQKHGTACPVSTARKDRTTRISSWVSRKEADCKMTEEPSRPRSMQPSVRLEQLKESRFLKPDYADNTNIKIAGMQHAKMSRFSSIQSAMSLTDMECES